MTARRQVEVVALALLVAGCGASGSEVSEVSTSTSTVRPRADQQQAPWLAHRPIPATGTNAEILGRFPSGEDAGTCRPVGTEPAIWSPTPGDEAGFGATSRSEDGSAQTSKDFEVAASEWSTTFADGSVAYVDEVPADRSLFLALPTPTSATWCIYSFAIPQDTSYETMLASMRYLSPD